MIRKFGLAVLLLALCRGVWPAGAGAFADRPAAVLVLGNTGRGEDLSGRLVERVKRRFRFPHYKFLTSREIERALAGRLPPPGKRRPRYDKPALASIAGAARAELLVVIWVEELDEQIIYPRRPFGETFYRTLADLDIMAYRVFDDTYLSKKIRYAHADYYPGPRAPEAAAYALEEALAEFKERLPDPPLSEGFVNVS
jgi:hypothetical protein